MNRVGFRLQGDMNWHDHCGIFTAPIQVAVRYKVPLMLWGEHGFMDLGGMYSYNDFVEFTAKYRLEHALRGYDWHDFTDEGLERLGRPELKEGLREKDLLWAKYPTDEEIDEVGVRGIYLEQLRELGCERARAARWWMPTAGARRSSHSNAPTGCSRTLTTCTRTAFTTTSSS